MGARECYLMLLNCCMIVHKCVRPQCLTWAAASHVLIQLCFSQLFTYTADKWVTVDAVSAAIDWKFTVHVRRLDLCFCT